MTEKPEISEQSVHEKLLIDDPSDFQFHAAYLGYSEAFDRTDNSEIKKNLNQNIQDLQQGKISYSTFYMNISQYRPMSGFQTGGSGRAFIKTQKKKEWRRETQKQEREKRHRK